MGATSAQNLDRSFTTFGTNTELTTTLVDSNDKRLLSPDPWARPLQADTGFALGSITTSVDLRVTFHRESQSRTVWYVVDEDNAPLTGNYIIEIDGTSVTYNATTEAPADVDALLSGIAAAIDADGTVGPLVNATRVKVKDTTSSGSYDAVRITAVASTGTPGNGIPDGAGYNTFAIGASTAFPEDADLYILREVDSASLRLWTKKNYEVASAVESNFNGPIAEHDTSWVVGGNGDLGALDDTGYDERANLAARSAVWLQLYSPVTTDETITIASSGAGVYGVVNVAMCVAAPAVLED